MSTYSPAPWSRRLGVCRNDHPDTSADVLGAHGEFVADCGCHELANGNARLIAAAPDMLDALREVAHHADDGCGFMVNVRAALAKAEGR